VNLNLPSTIVFKIKSVVITVLLISENLIFTGIRRSFVAVSWTQFA